MNWKKLWKILLFPHIAIMIILIPVAIVFLVYSMVFVGTKSVISIVSYVISAYTFTSLVFAIVNIVKYRKYSSPVFAASKAINLAEACVSMLTLEATMLTTFGEETMDMTIRKIFLGISGSVISSFIIMMALYMIVRGTKKIKLLETSKE